MIKPTFALVDCNNFYASCEKLFRPDIQDKPVIVLSNNDGCVIARSKEVKALGIKMGTPFFKIQQAIKQHDIQIFSSNYALYGDMSRRVMQTLEVLAPRVEIYSIDEAFLDLSGIERCVNLLEFGQNIKDTVAKHTGLQVGVGIAPTKTLAKLANYAAKTYPKTGGVVDLTARERQIKLMKITPVEEVWGVGRRLSKRLNIMNIHTAYDLAITSPLNIRRHFSVVLEQTVMELNGESCLELEDIASTKKQIVCSRSFGERITDYTEMSQAVADYTVRAAEKLRGQKQRAKQLTVFIMTSRFNDPKKNYTNSSSIGFVQPTQDTRDLLKAAQAALKSIYKPGYQYAKAGVMLADFFDEHHMQYDLFANTPQQEKLMRVLDSINQNSRHTLFFASQGINPNWAMKREYLSPAYTTNWNELLVVR